jgi:glycosyltransferase involved in cell wall biosynthesis
VADPLVSVVIPARNAERTIDETLRSVRSQTHRELEIIAVDDGSSDGTAATIRRHAAIDPRVRLIQEPNAGVAAARNTGWRAARSELIAFIDADDLWASTKIERQLASLTRCGGRTGLVYCWSWRIDSDSTVTDNRHRPNWRGNVLERLFIRNFVGNGSAALVRRQALVDAGGFESGLRDAGAEGCEDILFYCRVAESYEFEVVEEPLVGYRYLPDNMSSNLPRMLRSWMLVMDEMVRRHPDAAPLLHRGLRTYATGLFARALRERQLNYASAILSLLVRRDPAVAARVMAINLPARWASRRAGRVLRRWRDRSAGPDVSMRFPIGELQ